MSKSERRSTPSPRELAALKDENRRLQGELSAAAQWRESAQILMAVLDTSSDAILLHTLDGRVLDVNRTFLDLHGISREEALRLTIADISSPAMAMETASAIWAKVLAGEPQVFEWTGLRYSCGTEFDAEISLRRVQLAGEEVILAHVRDITRYKRAEAEIRASHEQLQRAYGLLEGIAEGTDDQIAAQDTALRYIFFNRAYHEEIARIFGVDLQIGDSMLEMLAPFPDDQEKAGKLWRRALAGETFSATAEFGDPGRQRTIYDLHYAPLVDAAGRLYGAAHMMRDITAKVHGLRRLHQREQQFRAFFENAAVGTMQMDLTGRLQMVNDRFCRMVGYRREELLGRSILALTHPADRARSRADLGRLGSGETSNYHAEKRYLRKAGGEVWVHVSNGLVLSTEGAPLHIVSIVQDISDRKHAEIDLRLAKQAAEGANQAKSQFLANMSHELRTPMTVILGALDFLKDFWTAPEREEMLAMAETSAQRLLDVINDLLDISRIEARQLQIEEKPADIRSCVRQAVQMFAKPAREKGLQLAWTVDPQVPDRVRSDPLRIGQVLINLVGNAVKFTRQGEIFVRVGADHGWLLFAVRDTGIGIPAGKIDQLFQPFTQVDSSSTRPFGGTGLGLAISRKLAELLGGTVTVASDLGKGSTFTFSIPLQPVAAAAVETAEPAERSARPLHVLLVEDDPTITDLMKMILRKYGAAVETARNGREAVAKWRADGVDLILMDVQMPEMNGLEATRTIRDLENGAGNKTRIVALTAHVRPEDRQECLAAGMDGFLAKPIVMEELQHLLETLPGAPSQAVAPPPPADRG